jgi:hypothetical protein
MSDEVIVRMTVKFIDGSKENYEFPRQKIDESIITKKIQEALESKYLIIDLKSKVQVIPIHNILSIEVTPPPLQLPSNTIKEASLV